MPMVTEFPGIVAVWNPSHSAMIVWSVACATFRMA